jgi:hypothetical protein
VRDLLRRAEKSESILKAGMEAVLSVSERPLAMKYQMR